MMGTPQCCQFNCMALTKDIFPRLRTNKRPDKCIGCTGMQAHGTLEDIPSYDDPPPSHPLTYMNKLIATPQATDAWKCIQRAKGYITMMM